MEELKVISEEIWIKIENQNKAREYQKYLEHDLVRSFLFEYIEYTRTKALMINTEEIERPKVHRKIYKYIESASQYWRRHER
jgi:hypothetical protein